MSAPNCLVLAKASKSILWRYCCVPLIFSKEVNSWSSDIIFQTLSKVSNVLSFISFSNCLNSVKFLPSSLMHRECIKNLKQLSVWYLNILLVLWKHLFLHYSDFSPFHHLGNCTASWLGSKKTLKFSLHLVLYSLSQLLKYWVNSCDAWQLEKALQNFPSLLN